MDEHLNNITRKAERAVEAVLNNELPMPRCQREKEHVKNKREKVKQELANKLGAVGPSQMK